MKNLVLIRDRNPGFRLPGERTGAVAEAVVFADGTAVLHWMTSPAATESYPSEAAMRQVREKSGRCFFGAADAAPAENAPGPATCRWCRAPIETQGLRHGWADMRPGFPALHCPVNPGAVSLHEPGPGFLPPLAHHAGMHTKLMRHSGYPSHTHSANGLVTFDGAGTAMPGPSLLLDEPAGAQEKNLAGECDSSCRLGADADSPEELAGAIDLASDQDHGSWLVRGGRRIAYLGTVDDGEMIEARLAALPGFPAPGGNSG